MYGKKRKKKKKTNKQKNKTKQNKTKTFHLSSNIAANELNATLRVLPPTSNLFCNKSGC